MRHYCFRLRIWFGNTYKQVTTSGSSILQDNIINYKWINWYLTNWFSVLAKCTWSAINLYLLNMNKNTGNNDTLGDLSQTPQHSRSFKCCSQLFQPYLPLPSHTQSCPHPNGLCTLSSLAAKLSPLLFSSPGTRPGLEKMDNGYLLNEVGWRRFLISASHILPSKFNLII